MAFKREWIFDWQEDWSQFFTPCNWRTFRFAWVEFKHEPWIGGAEATVVFLGLGLRVRLNYAETEATREMAQQVAEIEAEYNPTPARAEKE